MSGAPDRSETVAFVYSQSELAVLPSLLGWEDARIPAESILERPAAARREG